VKLEIVTIGTELLLGYTVDSNAAELGRALAAAGAEITRRVTVADRPDAIRAAVAEALERTGFVVTTGGLGPTRDDMTKTVVAELFGKPLVLDEGLLAGITARFQRLGRPMPAVNRTQADVPEGATILPNPRGTAPGLWIEDARGRVAVLLPGVPREMRGLLVEEVLPRLVRRDSPGARPRVVLSRTVRTTGVPESALAERLGAIETEIAPLTLAYLPSTDGVDLRLTAWSLEQGDAETRLATAAGRLQQLAGEHWYGDDGADLAAVVLEALRRKRQRLGVAESCTGGMVAERITNIPGASDTPTSSRLPPSECRSKRCKRTAPFRRRPCARWRKAPSGSSRPRRASPSPGSRDREAARRRSRWGPCGSPRASIPTPAR